MNNQTQTNSVERISLTSNSIESNGYSGSSSISDDGRYITFSSDATNLVPNDNNNSVDTFIYDRLNKTVELINLAPNNTQANATTSLGSISGNGRYITFASMASNLVANDTNGQRDIFVYDRLEQTTERISVATGGTQANGLNLFSAISDDGRYVAFESMASNLVANDTNGQRDIFVRDRVEQTTERVNVANDGTQANSHGSLDSISDDGRYITFTSSASNLVANDTNEQSDVFVYDRVEQTTERISVGNNGTQADGFSSFGFISGDGRYIAFESAATNLVTSDTNGLDDVFVYDRVDRTTERISMAIDGTQSNGYSYAASISDDGRYVAFLSDAENLVASDTNERADIFVYNRLDRITKRFDGNSFPSITGNGQYVVFNSSLDNLVADDNNQAGDVFAIDLGISSDNSESTGSGTIDSDTSDSETSNPETTVSTNSGTTNLETSNPETTDSTNSGTSNPETTDSETTDLETNDSGTIDSDTIDSETTNPETADSETTDSTNSGTTDLETIDSDTIDSETSNPETTDSETNDSGTIDSDTTDSGTTDSETTDTTDSGTTDLETIDSETNDSGTTDSDTTDSTNSGTTNSGTTDLETNDSDTTDLDLNRFSTDEVNRFYQFEKGFHLYTTDDVEIDYVRQQSAAGELSYQYEGEKFTVLTDDKDALTGATIEGVDAVYRFFNTETGSHLYTTDEVERAFIEENLPNYSAEGIKYYAFESQPQGVSTIPVYRLLNTDTGSHLYTIEQSELNYIQDELPNFALENNGEAAFYVFEL